MPIKYKHSNSYALYFYPFTCNNWLPLFHITDSYDTVYNWFTILKIQRNVETIGFVIMPNHVHCIMYFPDEKYNLNTLVANGKRFMAYTIVKRLQQLNRNDTLKLLQNDLTEREKRKGQLHKVFKDSFDAKAIFSERFLMQKLQYIHHNPVRGKWNLAKDFTMFEHSSASFYEKGTAIHFKPKNFAEL